MMTRIELCWCAGAGAILLLLLSQVITFRHASGPRHAELGCRSNLRMIGQAVFLYESPSGFGKTPAVHDAAIRRNRETGLPLLALFRAGTLDDASPLICPLNASPLGMGRNRPRAELTVFAQPDARELIPDRQTDYLFTLFYHRGSAPSRVIAGDAGTPGWAGSSPNHQEHGGERRDSPVAAANALFPDCHVEKAASDYSVEGAQRLSGQETDGNLWRPGSVSEEHGGAGTLIGAYESQPASGAVAPERSPVR